MDEKFMWLMLSFWTGGNINVIEKLDKHYGNIRKIISLSKGDWYILAGKKVITEKMAVSIVENMEKYTEEYIKNILNENSIKYITFLDDDYPANLLKIEGFPKVLFYKGHMPDNKKVSVGMVGSRRCSRYGQRMCKTISKQLSEYGVQIISGLARGIDTYAHNGAIEGGTPTFAVLGCGVDICYPMENVETYMDIIKNGGGIISEYPPGVEALGWHFPLRNRIISGISDSIAVIEAAENSGSFHTVRYALDQGKDVFAMPGRVDDELSQGPNSLLKSGAGVLTCGKDILQEMMFEIKPTIENTSEDQIIKCIKNRDMDIEELKEKTGLSITELENRLLELVLAGKIYEPAKNVYGLVV